MHGMIFLQLSKFADHTYGAGTFSTLLTDAGLGERVYLPIQTYPDAEVQAIVAAAATRTGLDPTRVLFAFGRFLAPELLAAYKPLVKPHWRTLDVIEQAEQVMHRAVRNDLSAAPPRLEVTRNGRSLELRYSSERNLCVLAHGLVVGIAEHYDEGIVVRETACRRRGAPVCTFQIRLATGLWGQTG